MPYPGKRPYPNALDPSDAHDTDYDGDAMALREESLMWLRFAGRRRSPGRGVRERSRRCVYSDGLQRSRGVAAPAPAALLNWALDLDDDGDARATTSATPTVTGSATGTRPEASSSRPGGPPSTTAPVQPKESKYPDIDFLDNEDLAPA